MSFLAGVVIPGGVKAIVSRYWKLGVGAIFGALLCWPLAYCAGDGAGYDRREAEYKSAELKAIEVQLESATLSDVEREVDIRTLSDIEKETIDDIRSAGSSGEPISGARAARYCKRLRDAGRSVSDIPACSGRSRPSGAAPTP